ncbi:phosphatidylserine decarboxylase [Peribacillus acanthi]|uniref:phosphatidylserine decarboxylase n=1 Tax=Peribacillus acanthi TaxID=2171554 RepID=UPI000D3E9F8B|nr:phosphatidylserine decarboxylase [Peribacillus acanthi]
MIEPLYKAMIELTNGRITSQFMKNFSQSKLSKKVIPSFSKLYGINTQEMKRGLHEFETLHDFFTRTLKDEARVIDLQPKSLISPVDAVFEDFGIIEDTSNITVKGKIYSIHEMLGDEEVLKKYIGGNYAVLYLSPSHYHRIHSPIEGQVIARWTLGGKSYPVNKAGLKYGKAPLSKNYRVITEIKHSDGHVALVKVGAMFVNSIEVTNLNEQVKKGEEMAYFSFGSTIVLLFEKATFTLEDSLNLPAEIKLGQVLGKVGQ